MMGWWKPFTRDSDGEVQGRSATGAGLVEGVPWRR